MPLILLRIIKRTWKLWAVLGVAALIFWAGALWQGKRDALDRLETEQRHLVELAMLQQEMRAAHEIVLADEAVARETLARDLGLLSASHRDLLSRLNVAILTPDVETITVERTIEIPGECPMVLANPFSPNFKRLWDDATRGHSTGAATPP